MGKTIENSTSGKSLPTPLQTLMYLHSPVHSRGILTYNNVIDLGRVGSELSVSNVYLQVLVKQNAISLLKKQTI